MLNPLTSLTTSHCSMPYCARHVLPATRKDRQLQLQRLIEAINGVPHAPCLRVPFDLQFLIRAIRYELGDNGLDSAGVDVGRIQALMAAYSSNRTDWAQYAWFDKYRYTRNLVDDGNGQFNLLILAWGPNHHSAIHDHSHSHCIMKVLDGSLVESQYYWPENTTQEERGRIAFSENEHYTSSKADGKITTVSSCSSGTQRPLRLKQERTYRTDEVTYIHDKIGLHRVGNPSTTLSAVSLHLYTPPIRACRSFNETTGKARSSSCQTFYSQYGVRTSCLSD
ncbi:hypothetical protein IWQ62_000783 [Dispira parvispora]|uniref:Cysteine dioxygenase n=1 Tax=Dispira parvispora TaxID=1520584 RepID=A0A9W8B0J8_9FUNG|nr:hypothetical protein IWQ62_000783 [Dispira parvispora]